MMIFDPLYLLLIGPPMLLSLWASSRVRSAFERFSRVPAARGLSGAEAARVLLDRAGIRDVRIIRSRGVLSDHYNPATKTLALSDAVFGSRSIAAVGVACHEAGHALQHAQNYAPLWLRSALVPTAGIGSRLGFGVMFFGLLLGMGKVILFGAVLFGAVLAFQLVTLPVEFDASARAKRLAFEHGIVGAGERAGVAKVLDAAAWTYVAAAISTLATLFYFLLRAGVLGGRRS